MDFQPGIISFPPRVCDTVVNMVSIPCTNVLVHGIDVYGQMHGLGLVGILYQQKEPPYSDIKREETCC